MSVASVEDDDRTTMDAMLDFLASVGDDVGDHLCTPTVRGRKEVSSPARCRSRSLSLQRKMARVESHSTTSTDPSSLGDTVEEQGCNAYTNFLEEQFCVNPLKLSKVQESQLRKREIRELKLQNRMLRLRKEYLESASGESSMSQDDSIRELLSKRKVKKQQALATGSKKPAGKPESKDARPVPEKSVKAETVTPASAQTNVTSIVVAMSDNEEEVSEHPTIQNINVAVDRESSKGGSKPKHQGDDDVSVLRHQLDATERLNRRLREELKTIKAESELERAQYVGKSVLNSTVSKNRQLTDELTALKSVIDFQKIQQNEAKTLRRELTEEREQSRRLSTSLQAFKSEAERQKRKNDANQKVVSLLRKTQKVQMDELVKLVSPETVKSAKLLSMEHELYELKCEMAVERIEKRKYKNQVEKLGKGGRTEVDIGSASQVNEGSWDEWRQEALRNEDKKSKALQKEQAKLKKQHHSLVQKFEKDLQSTVSFYRKREQAFKVEILELLREHKKQAELESICKKLVAEAQPKRKPIGDGPETSERSEEEDMGSKSAPVESSETLSTDSSRETGSDCEAVSNSRAVDSSDQTEPPVKSPVLEPCQDSFFDAKEPDALPQEGTPHGCQPVNDIGTHDPPRELGDQETEAVSFKVPEGTIDSSAATTNRAASPLEDKGIDIDASSGETPREGALVSTASDSPGQDLHGLLDGASAMVETEDAAVSSDVCRENAPSPIISHESRSPDIEDSVRDEIGQNKASLLVEETSQVIDFVDQGDQLTREEIVETEDGLEVSSIDSPVPVVEAPSTQAAEEIVEREDGLEVSSVDSPVPVVEAPSTQAAEEIVETEDGLEVSSVDSPVPVVEAPSTQAAEEIVKTEDGLEVSSVDSTVSMIEAPPTQDSELNQQRQPEGAIEATENPVEGTFPSPCPEEDRDMRHDGEFETEDISKIKERIFESDASLSAETEALNDTRVAMNEETKIALEEEVLKTTCASMPGDTIALEEEVVETKCAPMPRDAIALQENVVETMCESMPRDAIAPQPDVDELVVTSIAPDANPCVSDMVHDTASTEVTQERNDDEEADCKLGENKNLSTTPSVTARPVGFDAAFLEEADGSSVLSAAADHDRNMLDSDLAEQRAHDIQAPAELEATKDAEKRLSPIPGVVSTDESEIGESIDFCSQGIRDLECQPELEGRKSTEAALPSTIDEVPDMTESKEPVAVESKDEDESHGHKSSEQATTTCAATNKASTFEEQETQELDGVPEPAFTKKHLASLENEDACKGETHTPLVQVQSEIALADPGKLAGESQPLQTVPSNVELGGKHDEATNRRKKEEKEGANNNEGHPLISWIHWFK